MDGDATETESGIEEQLHKRTRRRPKDGSELLRRRSYVR